MLTILDFRGTRLQCQITKYCQTFLVLTMNEFLTLTCFYGYFLVSYYFRQYIMIDSICCICWKFQTCIRFVWILK